MLRRSRDGTCGVRDDVFGANGLSDPPIA